MGMVTLWIKSNKLFFGLIIILLFIIPLIVTHILFKVDSGTEWLRAEWSAGDVLAYIAGFEAFIGTITLGALAFWQNHQIHKQHVESLAPALSMSLISFNGSLYLTIKNTGQNEAKEINISVEKIENNGDKNDLMLDGLFSSTFELYPEEFVQGHVAFSGEDICTQIFPQITVSVSYLWPQLNRREQYIRKVIYDNKYTNKIAADVNIDKRAMESDIDKIARATVRIANYLDGCQVAKFDELNILAGKSLRNDIVELLKTSEETKILNRNETIEKFSALQNLQEE